MEPTTVETVPVAEPVVEPVVVAPVVVEKPAFKLSPEFVTALEHGLMVAVLPALFTALLTVFQNYSYGPYDLVIQGLLTWLGHVAYSSIKE